MSNRWIICSVLVTAGAAAMGVLASPVALANAPIDLTGTWRFELDRNDVGIQERWFEQDLSGRIRLPGSLPQQGIGDEVTVETKWTGTILDRSWFTSPEYAKYRQAGNVKVPFWLQPDKYYAGPAWYQRDIEIPQAWQGKRVVLMLERPHWETRVWVDGCLIGTSNALGTPHEYDLCQLAVGKHRLTIRVDNRMIVDVGENSHSVSDHTQGNWNGIVGRIELRVTNLVWIEDVQVYPHVATKSATIKGTLGNATGKAGQGTVTLAISEVQGKKSHTPRPVATEVRWSTESGAFETEIPLGDDARLWDEFSPALYQLTASLKGGELAADVKSVTFGLREISTQGTQFVLNGRKIFIRGTLECAIFPKTGHPPTDVESWKRILRIAKSHGLNNLRFHSWCPPEAAFVAADEMGFYYQVECSSWGRLGDGKPLDTWIFQEAAHILRYYGNHPSFLLMPYGNEPGGRNSTAFLAKWVNHYKASDPRRLYTSGSGWPEIAENQFHVSPGPRIQAWGAGLKSRINAAPPETCTDYRDYIQKRNVPVISHEIGQWCVYPNFDEMAKYTGYLKSRNFEIFRETLEAHHMGDLAHRFLLASGKLQTLCYKEDIESALRTPGMGGFQLLDLHDFPGQGTAMVGVLDPFWDSKGYVSAKQYSRFCNSTVPLARLSKRVFTTDEVLKADLEVAHFGPSPLNGVAATWKLAADSGKIVAAGELPKKDIPVDNGVPLGSVSVNLADVPAPARYKLIVGFSGTQFENDWDVWVYPSKLDCEPQAGVIIADALNDEVLAALNAGGKVLLLIPPQKANREQSNQVALGFSSIFWNTAWTDRQAPHTLGILCDPRHPLFAGFPTDYHSNWQWWYLVSRAGAMILDELPPQLRPSVQVIDDWFTARRLGLVFECKLGRGKLVVCSIDLKNDLDTNPVARQFRHSLLRYMAGDRFDPTVDLIAAQVRRLIASANTAAVPK